MIRKWAALILAMMMAFSAVVSFAEEPDGINPDDLALYSGPEYDYNHLVTGHTTALSGGFSNRIWGSNTSDLDVSALINGYNLVTWEYDAGCFKPDPSVVSNADALLVYDDAEGNRTYSLALDYTDLKYSDGTPITAYDYAFNILLHVAPQAAELGGNTEWFDCILGMEDYKAGKTKTLQGLRVVNENMINITVSHEYRPFFYELGYLWCYPSPIHVIAPGCKITDNGNGCCIEGDFTAELLQKTMLDPETGYLTHPSVVSGPYMLTSFDGVTAEFEINPEYKGNKEGVKPSIQYLTYTLANNDTEINDLSEGKFGLINKAVNAETINEGMSLLNNGGFSWTTYPRIGQSQIVFCCERPAMSDPIVRQAMSFCFNKEQAVSDYTGAFGLPMDGMMGIGQWMYGAVVARSITPPLTMGNIDDTFVVGDVNDLIADISNITSKEIPTTVNTVTDSKTEKTTETKVDTEEPPVETKTEEKAEAITETKTEEKAEATTETKTEEKAEAITETKTEEKAEATTETKTEEKAEATTETKTEEKAEATTETKTEEKAEATTEIKTEEKTEATTEIKTEEKTEATTEIKTEENTVITTETQISENTVVTTETQTTENTVVTGNNVVTTNETVVQNQSVVVNNTETVVVTEQQSMSEGGNTPGVASNVGTASSTGTANAAGQTQTAGTVTEEAPAAEPKTQETPAEEVPVAEPKTQETPVEEVPAVEPQTQETPAEVVPTAEPKEQETPVEEAPAAEPQTQETPVEETPVEETPAEEAPVEEKPTEETPAEEAPVQEVTPEEQAAADEEARLEEERKKAEEEFERAKKAWDALSQVMQTTVPKYRYDPEQVEEVSQMLSDGGWALNINGEPYDPTKDDVRCKEINGEIIPLDLTLAYPEGNAVAYQIESSLLNQLKDQGIKVTLVPVELNTLRDMLHRKIERNCDLIYISTNYDEVFDPSPSFDPADAEIGKTNLSGINDPILYELAKDMSKTEPGDNYTYATKWVKFQARYQQVVPAIPVYGNVYVDFFTSCLQNYDVSQNVTWTEAILYAYMSDPDMSEKPEEEEEPEFEDDGDFEIFD